MTDKQAADVVPDEQRRIRELEQQVAVLQAERMRHVPETVDPVIRDLVSERLRQGLSQRDVVHRIDCSPSSVSQWERGITSPTLTKLRDWADALGMNLDVTIAARDNTPVSTDGPADA